MIQKLWTFAKGLPWWVWVLIGLAVLYFFNMASGSICSRKTISSSGTALCGETEGFKLETYDETKRQ